MSNFLAKLLLNITFLCLLLFFVYKFTYKPIIRHSQISPNIIFSAGFSGSSGNSSENNIPLQSGGGGGAGGLTISHNYINFYNTRAEKGSDEGNNFGGLGGKGFGAGGGGAGCLFPYGATIGGKGNDGFVYIFEDNVLIMSSIEEYIVKSSRLNINIILMGGGGGGGGVLLNNPSDYIVKSGGNGGCAGNIIRATNINSIPGSKLNIIIGQGGTSGQNGGNTSVTNNNLQISLIAYGGFNGNNILLSTISNNLITVNTPQSAGSAIGSNFSKFTGKTINSNGNIIVNSPGGIVHSNVIYLLN